MSGLAPVISNEQQRQIVVEALRLINSNENGDRFPLVHDYDPHGNLKGNVLAIEAKNIFITAMIGGHWPSLLKGSKGAIPDPLEVPENFDITLWEHWPVDAKTEGTTGMAVDREANILAKLAFQNLAKLSVAAASAKKPRKQGRPRGKSSKSSSANIDESDDENSVAANTEYGTGSMSGAMSYVYDDEDRATSAGQEAWEVGHDNQDKEAEVQGPSEEHEAGGQVDVDDASEPDPSKVKQNYRLVRDWEYWPTTGVVGAAVSEAQQARYGVMTDLMFETMKVDKRKKSKKAVAPRKKKTASEMASTDNVKVIVNDEVAMNILLELFNGFTTEGGGKRILRASNAAITEQAESFLARIIGMDNIQFDSTDNVSKTIQQVISDLAEEELEEMYIILSKTAQEAEAAEAASDADEGVASDEAGAEMDDVADSQPSTRGRRAGGSRGRPRGRPRGRGRGNSRGTATAALTGGGSKRRRGTESDGEEDDESHNDENDSDAIFVPESSKNKKRKT